MIEVIVALIGAVSIVVVALVNRAENRKTRRLNTEEHNAGRAERARAEEATLAAIDILHGDVRRMDERLADHTNLLVDHITDTGLHHKEQ